MLLFRVDELHEQFLKDNPNNVVSISKFYQLKPREVILTNANGIHNVCVCIIHNNVELLFESSGLLYSNPLNLESDTNKLSYRHYMQILMCNSPSDNCYQNLCNVCRAKDISQEVQALKDHFSEEEIEIITFWQWTNTDRSNIIQISLEVDDFVDHLISSLQDLKLHSYIASQQTNFFKHKKETLKEDEAILAGDFRQLYIC